MLFPLSELLEKHRTVSTEAIVRVGEGRGFVVERRRERLVVTAAHCLPSLPPPHPASYLHERTFEDLLAPFGAAPTVWAECLFADPIADIAVLGSPDNQELYHQADAYEELMARSTALTIADAPKMIRERVQGWGGRSFWVDKPGRGSARVLSLDGEWAECTVTAFRKWLSVDQGELVVGGMSGSPILSPDGRAIGLMSTGKQNPILKENLPRWFFRR